MLKISVKADFKEVTRYLDNVQKKQVPFATSLAINWTLKDVKASLRKEMRTVFNNPSKFTLNSLFTKVSKKNDLNGFIWVKDGAEHLFPHIYGGTRPLKRFEKRLARSSISGGEHRVVTGFAIPSKRIVTGKGKVSRGRYTQVLSGTGTHPDKASRSKKGSKNAKFFVGKVKGQDGVWERTRTGVKPVFILVPTVHYRKRFDFFGVAEERANKRFKVNFDRAMTRALRTAR